MLLSVTETQSKATSVFWHKLKLGTKGLGYS